MKEEIKNDALGRTIAIIMHHDITTSTNTSKYVAVSDSLLRIISE